jgi:hypothetical protein
VSKRRVVPPTARGNIHIKRKGNFQEAEESAAIDRRAGHPRLSFLAERRIRRRVEEAVDSLETFGIIRSTRARQPGTGLAMETELHRASGQIKPTVARVKRRKWEVVRPESLLPRPAVHRRQGWAAPEKALEPEAGAAVRPS